MPLRPSILLRTHLDTAVAFKLLRHDAASSSVPVRKCLRFGTYDLNLMARVLNPPATQTASRIQRHLTKGATNRFSEEAVSRLEDLVARHIDGIVHLAIGSARDNLSDVVSVSDIDVAARTLAPPRRRTARVLEVVGGLVAGAGLSEFYVALTASHPSGLAYALATGSVIVGSTMIAVGLTRNR